MNDPSLNLLTSTSLSLLMLPEEDKIELESDG